MCIPQPALLKDLTESEWGLLRHAPIDVIAAAVLANRVDPVTLLTAARTTVQIFNEQPQPNKASELISLVISDISNADAQEGFSAEEQILRREFSILGYFHDLNREKNSQKMILDRCIRVTHILSESVPETQANEFKKWLLFLAYKMAAIARNEGWCSAGQERTHQHLTLQKLEKALGRVIN